MLKVAKCARQLAWLAVALASLSPCIPLAAQGGNAEVLTNQTIVQLVLAKLPNDVIQAKIQSSKNAFDLTVSGLGGLVANKVPTAIIKAMLATAPKKGGTEVLTNESVIQMVTAKVPRDIILEKIQATRGNFDVTSTGLVSLNTNRVPKDIIKVMMVNGT